MLANVFGMENQRWFEAVRSVNFSRIDQVVDEKSTNTRDRRDKRTDLISAAESNNLEMVDHLLNIDHKEDEALELILKWRNSLRLGEQDRQQHLRSWRAAVDVYAENIWSGTALMDAVWQENEEMVRNLIDGGADVDAKDNDGRTALIYATEKGGYRRNEIIQLLLDRGADINAKDKDGRTALMEAVWQENEEIVQLLLNSGADVNAKDKWGGTALMEAVWRENEEIVRNLIDGGADVNAKNKDGRTALMGAVWQENEEIVQLLLNSGADVNAKDKWSGTSLMDAAEKGNEEIVRILLDKGADVNAKGIDVQTALMFEEENEEMPSLIDESQTALGIAMTKTANDSDKSRKGIYEDIAELLIDEGADVEAEFVKWISKDSTKKITPLIYAVEEENVKMVKKLMAKGADVNKESTNGDTALGIAERLRNEEIKNLLLKSGMRR